MGRPKIGIHGSSKTALVLMNLALHRDDIKLVAIIDPYHSAEGLAEAYNNFFRLTTGGLRVTQDRSKLRLGDKVVKFYPKTDKKSDAWTEAGTEYVVECEGDRADKDMVKAHLNERTARKVVIAVPGWNVPMFVMGVNEEKYNPGINVVSLANCTTSCLARLLKVLHGQFPIARGSITVTRKNSKGGESIMLEVPLKTAMAAKPINEVLRELDADLKIKASPAQDDVYAIKLTGKLKRGADYQAIARAVNSGIPNANIERAKDGQTVELVARYNNTLRVHCSHVIGLILHMARCDQAAIAPNWQPGTSRPRS